MKIVLHSLLLALLASACGDDGGGISIDAAPPVDARFSNDAARQSCSAEMNPCSDLDFETVCDTARAYCVECAVPADCAPASSFGPACKASDGTCHCGTDADCQDKDNGSYCHPIVGACGCLTVDDCPGGSECELEPYLGTGIRRCRPL
jgi:hypothetical protein